MPPLPPDPRNGTPTTFEVDAATRAQLLANERDCENLHIRACVDSVSREHKVALCSVYQTSRRFGRRVYDTSQLLERAEWALSPLRGMGITPMLNVRGWPQQAGPRLPQSWYALLEWMRGMGQRPGRAVALPLAEPSLAPQRRDPFGFREALGKALEKVSRPSGAIVPQHPG